MEKAEEALKTAAVTLEKYRKNKTLVPDADLKGKYKVPFEKLKQQLKDELEIYLKEYILSGLVVKKPADELVEKINQIIIQDCIGKRVGRAAFRDFDIHAVKQIAEECRKKVYEVWTEYFNQHVCLYVYGQCFNEENPDNPLIYNDLVDKFWNEDAGEWTYREKPPGAAILIFISEKERSG